VAGSESIAPFIRQRALEFVKIARFRNLGLTISSAFAGISVILSEAKNPGALTARKTV
jgi:hypothetical protein